MRATGRWGVEGHGDGVAGPGMAEGQQGPECMSNRRARCRASVLHAKVHEARQARAETVRG